MQIINYSKSFHLESPLLENLAITKNKNKRLFVVTRNHGRDYTLVPSCFTFSISNNYLIVSCRNKRDLDHNSKFFEELRNILLLNPRFFTKNLMIKGLGYKVSLSHNRNLLKFKIGYSNRIFIRVPNDVTVKIRRTQIKVNSLNKVSLGNFCMIIKSLRKASVYKCKGVFFKHEKIKLKELKKK